MTTKVLDIGAEFSRFPGGRVTSDGPYSGQAFRDQFIIPALNTADQVDIKLDSVMGYGSSFLEECFGGLVRSGISVDDLKQRLKFSYADKAFSFYEDEIWLYINEAAK